MKCEVSQNRCLLRGVVTFDIERWVCLEITELGCLGHGGFERDTCGIHAVKNVIRRTVNDSHDSLNLVAGKRFAQRANDRNGGGDCGLEVELRTDLLGGIEQFGSVCCKQRLVGRDDIAARVERLQNVGSCRFDATHHFDDNVSAQNQALDIGGDQFGRKTLGA